MLDWQMWKLSFEAAPLLASVLVSVFAHVVSVIVSGAAAMKFASAVYLGVLCLRYC